MTFFVSAANGRGVYRRRTPIGSTRRDDLQGRRADRRLRLLRDVTIPK